MKHLPVCFLTLLLALGCQYQEDTIRQRISAEQYEELMSLSYQEFDQTMDSGWRQYHDDPELQLLLIADYIERNNAPQQSLRWHRGQLHGMLNEYDEAIRYFEQCIYDDTSDSALRKAWNYYVHGTIAFMQKDEKKLDRYIDSLENHTENMNIEVLLRLKENFDKPYAEAY